MQMNLFNLHCRGATVYAAKPNCAEAERRANLFAQPRREQYMRLFRWIKFLKCSVRVEQCDPSDLFGGYPGHCAGFPENKSPLSDGRGDAGWSCSRNGLPLPRRNQSGLTDGNLSRNFWINSKLGLFRPERICETLALCIPIMSANWAGLSCSSSKNCCKRLFIFVNSYSYKCTHYFVNK